MHPVLIFVLIFLAFVLVWIAALAGVAIYILFRMAPVLDRLILGPYTRLDR